MKVNMVFNFLVICVCIAGIYAQQSEEICQLPIVTGGCEGYYPSWHYDKDRKQCVQVILGGCLGNANTFETREECQNLCVVDTTQDNPVILDEHTDTDLSAEEGNYVTMKCTVQGNPHPTITWRKENNLVDGSLPRYRIHSNGTLQIVGLYKNDTGTYHCIADNRIGNPARKDIRLTVTVPVRTNITMTQTTFPVGSEIAIPCDVDGHPIPRVQWYKSGQPLNPTESIQISESHRLTITRANSSDSGEYLCEAENGHSQSSSSVNIRVEGNYIHPNCTDHPFNACGLIAQARYCTHIPYTILCCKSCTETGQLPSYGPHLAT